VVVKVIHLVRDPRAVALSRRDYYPSARGLFAEDASDDPSALMIREASVLCRRVANDVRVGRQLQRLFPGRLLTLTYEQLAEDPVRWANEVYRFIGKNEAPRAALKRFEQQSDGESKEKSARFLASRWLNDRISRDEFDKINAHCADVLAFFPQFAASQPTVFRTQSPSPIYPKRPRVVRRSRRF
jgi:Sulfotransferase domain